MARNKIHKITLITLLAATLLLPMGSFAQDGGKAQSVDAFVGLYGRSDQEATFFYGGCSYTWWLNRYVGFAAGGMVGKSKVDAVWESKGFTYSMREGIASLNVIGEVKLALPLYRGFGLFGEGQFTFAPIPVNYISVEKRISPDRTENKGKYIYTRFNPAVMGNYGIYFQSTRDEVTARFMIGIGRGNFDALNSYRISTIDQQRLAEHIPRKMMVTNVFIKLSVFM